MLTDPLAAAQRAGSILKHANMFEHAKKKIEKEINAFLTLLKRDPFFLRLKMHW